MTTKIIADACCNHQGNKDNIKTMISSAGRVGIDYIKFQLYDVRNLHKDYPDYTSNYQYYDDHQVTDKVLDLILSQCKQANIKPLFTLFHTGMVERLLSRDISECKIASPDALNIELIDECLRAFDRVFISTGMINAEGLKTLKGFINTKPYKGRAEFLYCVSEYPTHYSNVNFKEMMHYSGFSDHTPDITASKQAIDLSLNYVERHYILNKDTLTKDAFISSDLTAFAELCKYRDKVAKINNYKLRWRG